MISTIYSGLTVLCSSIIKNKESIISISCLSNNYSCNLSNLESKYTGTILYPAVDENYYLMKMYSSVLSKTDQNKA